MKSRNYVRTSAYGKTRRCCKTHGARLSKRNVHSRVLLQRVIRDQGHSLVRGVARVNSLRLVRGMCNAVHALYKPYAPYAPYAFPRTYFHFFVLLLPPLTIGVSKAMRGTAYDCVSVIPYLIEWRVLSYFQGGFELALIGGGPGRALGWSNSAWQANQ